MLILTCLPARDTSSGQTSEAVQANWRCSTQLHQPDLHRSAGIKGCAKIREIREHFSKTVTPKEKGDTVSEIENWTRDESGLGIADSMDAGKTSATAEVAKDHLVESRDNSCTSQKDLNMAANELPQKRGPGRPRSEDKSRVSTGKSITASESDVNTIGSVTDSFTAPVNSTKSSVQKKFGGKRKVNKRFLLQFCMYVHA